MVYMKYQLKSGDKTNLHLHISGDVTCTSRQVATVFTRLWMDKTYLTHTQQMCYVVALLLGWVWQHKTR